MKTRATLFTLALGLLAGCLSLRTASAQDTPASPKAGAKSETPSHEAEMMEEMMKLAQPGSMHRELAQLVGDWDYSVKFSMTPGEALAEAGKGTAVRTAAMGGRYFIVNINGKMLMPGPDGKAHEAEFKGMAVEGYDNVKQKFLSTWIDNMGTGITLAEGSYDPASKSFTYRMEMEEMPGMKTKARQVVKILDADHLEMDWYESHGDQEAKTMEIDYARKK